MNHVPSCWLSNGPAIDRLLVLFNVYLRYFEDINRKPQNKQPKAKHYTRIMNTLIQHPDETKAERMFLKSVIPVFSEFLLVLQKNLPKFIFCSFLELTKALLLNLRNLRRSKPTFRLIPPMCPSKMLRAMNLSETDVIVAELPEIYEKLGTSKKLFHLNVLKFYKTAVSNVFRILHFDNKLLKATAILNPCYQRQAWF